MHILSIFYYGIGNKTVYVMPQESSRVATISVDNKTTALRVIVVQWFSICVISSPVSVKQVLKDGKYVLSNRGNDEQVLGGRMMLSRINIIFTFKHKTKKTEKLDYAKLRTMTYLLLFSSNIVLFIYTYNKCYLIKQLYLSTSSTCV